MKPISTALFTLVASIFILSGCTKHEPYVNIVYNCECGSMSLDGRDLAVRLAEGYVPSESSPNLFRYHVVADLRTSNEVDHHNPSHDIAFTIEVITDGSSTTVNAVDVLMANELEAPSLDVDWNIAGGVVKVIKTDSLHTLTFSNVSAGSSGNGGTIDAELYIYPQ
ncbi:MAG: hypothetical protein COA49_09470 [Bacteroidetes bacterium]|nr:MAG: hypothetical protein COA49_09470 [Bacteroidota bacterium]